MGTPKDFFGGGKMENRQKNRQIYISLARVLCAFAVVTIHANDCFKEFNIEGCWGIANAIETGLFFAVPVFMMITGATLMDYSERYSTKEYFIKRIQKTVIPYFVWCAISVILNVNTFLVYYFFINLFGVYLCIPLFSFIRAEYKEKVINYVVIISAIFNYFIPFIYEITKNPSGLTIPFDIANGYLIYALIGYLISKRDISLPIRLISYVISIVGFILSITGTYYGAIQAGELIETFRKYTNLPCLMASVGVFILIKEIGNKINNEKAIHLIEWLSGYTFPIYLIHFFIIELFMEEAFGEYVHLLTYKLTTPFFTIMISIGIAWVIRKIPVIRRILP